MNNRISEVKEMAEKLRELCDDIMVDLDMMSEEDYELMVAEDEELHSELCKVEDLERAIDEIFG